MFFRKREQIRQLENENFKLRLFLERQGFPFQLIVPVITTESGIEEVRFSGSPEAIRLLQERFKLEYKERTKK